MNHTDIVYLLYKGLISQKTEDGIPVNLQMKANVQDDPFDWWIMDEIQQVLPSSFEVFHAGALTTPDIVIRDRDSKQMVGLEIKKLIMSDGGNDPRGLTLDYNSCLPCGHAFIKVGDDTIVIPCYYVFALLDETSSKIVTLIILDGDFINYDLDLHKESKYANYSEYNHGPYGEGSVRHRMMYTYPNPLNSRITDFSMKHILIIKKCEVTDSINSVAIQEQINRVDKYGNSFIYYLVDDLNHRKSGDMDTLKTLTGVFDECKERQPKKRVAYMLSIPPIE